MGGIFGKLSYERDEALAYPVLEQMLEAVWHPGADSRGLQTASGIALGWRGDEPPDEADLRSTVVRTVVAVADAALTNAPELRARLTRAGRVVHHASDAALLAHAYDEWGDSCVQQLQGSFAVAIWDGRRRRLLLARDRAGTRPLYYALLQGHGVVFASTIRALLQDPGVSREWSPAAIDAYLAHGCVTGPLTPYARISKLEPAQQLVVDGRRFHLETYWAPTTGAGDFGDALGAAIAEQPAGAGILFSGGPASASLVGCAPHRDVLTVGVDQDTRELARADAEARRLGANPVLDVSAADLIGLAGELATCVDEPCADAALVSQLAVFRMASRHTTCAMTGHGAQALWSERAASPSAWPERERLALYTRAFADGVGAAPPAPPSPFDGLSVAGQLARHAGLELHFPHVDPGLISLARSSTRCAHPFRGPGSSTEISTPAAHRQRRHTWLRAAVDTLAPSILLTGRFDGRGMVLPSALRRLWEEHRLGRHDHTRRFWSLLMLELWFREYIDGGAIAHSLEYQLARAA